MHGSGLHFRLHATEALAFGSHPESGSQPPSIKHCLPQALLVSASPIMTIKQLNEANEIEGKNRRKKVVPVEDNA